MPTRRVLSELRYGWTSSPARPPTKSSCWWVRVACPLPACVYVYGVYGVTYLPDDPGSRKELSCSTRPPFGAVSAPGVEFHDELPSLPPPPLHRHNVEGPRRAGEVPRWRTGRTRHQRAFRLGAAVEYRGGRGRAAPPPPYCYYWFCCCFHGGEIYGPELAERFSARGGGVCAGHSRRSAHTRPSRCSGSGCCSFFHCARRASIVPTRSKRQTPSDAEAKTRGD